MLHNVQKIEKVPHIIENGYKEFTVCDRIESCYTQRHTKTHTHVCVRVSMFMSVRVCVCLRVYRKKTVIDAFHDKFHRGRREFFQRLSIGGMHVGMFVCTYIRV